MLYPLIAVFLATGYYDYKYKKIPDVFTAVGWLMLLFTYAFYANSAPLLIAGVSFAILFSLNAFAALMDKPPLSWGDILLLPLYMGYASSFESSTLFLAPLVPLVLIALYVAVTGKNKEVALAPFLAAASIFLLL